MRTANRVKPKTDFGIEVRLFTAQTGMTVKELAERSGVKYTTLIETTTAAVQATSSSPLSGSTWRTTSKRRRDPWR